MICRLQRTPLAKVQPHALVAAFLGWLFDGFEMGLFPLIGKPALEDLLPAANDVVRGQWFSVIIAVFLVGRCNRRSSFRLAW